VRVAGSGLGENGGTTHTRGQGYSSHDSSLQDLFSAVLAIGSLFSAMFGLEWQKIPSWL